MRIALLLLTAILTLGVVVACNSKQAQITQLPAVAQNQSPQPSAQNPPVQNPPVQNPADKARRINVEDLHDLWEKGKVLIIDTRSEPAYKQDHIKGAILIPAGDVGNRIDELPRDKMIVTYCT